jgi:hypothetical protein
MNVIRVPTDGRNFEYLSGEDPMLGAKMVGPVIAGIQKHGVIATAKHWINNNQVDSVTPYMQMVLPLVNSSYTSHRKPKEQVTMLSSMSVRAMRSTTPRSKPRWRQVWGHSCKCGPLAQLNAKMILSVLHSQWPDSLVLAMA